MVASQAIARDHSFYSSDGGEPNAKQVHRSNFTCDIQLENMRDKKQNAGVCGTLTEKRNLVVILPRLYAPRCQIERARRPRGRWREASGSPEPRSF